MCFRRTLLQSKFDVDDSLFAFFVSLHSHCSDFGLTLTFGILGGSL